MNIKYKRTGTVHKVDWQSRTHKLTFTLCRWFNNSDIEETTDPTTCKTCIRAERVRRYRVRLAYS